LGRGREEEKNRRDWIGMEEEEGKRMTGKE
jgi:hypothetical protein